MGLTPMRPNDRNGAAPFRMLNRAASQRRSPPVASPASVGSGGSKCAGWTACPSSGRNNPTASSSVPVSGRRCKTLSSRLGRTTQSRPRARTKEPTEGEGSGWVIVVRAYLARKRQANDSGFSASLPGKRAVMAATLRHWRGAKRRLTSHRCGKSPSSRTKSEYVADVLGYGRYQHEL